MFNRLLVPYGIGKDWQCDRLDLDPLPNFTFHKHFCFEVDSECFQIVISINLGVVKDFVPLVLHLLHQSRCFQTNGTKMNFV